MSRFDRFASWAASVVSRAWFFALCAGLVVGWTIGLPLAGLTSEIYHLALNSPTTAITFILVALLHNDQRQFENAVNRKLDALAEALSGVPGADRAKLLDLVGAEERTGAER